MTSWTQTHPTRQVIMPDGSPAEIDEEMVPLVTQLWRLGFETLLACQDVGEAILGGGTRTLPADRERLAVPCMRRAWLKVRSEDAPCILRLLRPMSDGEGWILHSPEEPHAHVWVSITFPRHQTAETATLLSRL